MIKSLLLLLVWYGTMLCAPTTKSFDATWRISLIDNIDPTGNHPRTVLGVNGAWPPPVITIQKGYLLNLKVINNLPFPTSLHFHGLFQNKTNFMDGPSMITQCPIPVNQEFLYSFTPKQTGTYWVHAHRNGQYVDGLRAPFVVIDNEEEKFYGYSEERTISLSDWYHTMHDVLVKQYLNPNNPSGVEPLPDAPLINDNQSKKLILSPGKVHRLRFVSMAALASFHVWIDGHNMTIIEIDGVNVTPFEVKGLIVAAAQRYSVLITAKSDSEFNYLLNAEFNLAMFDSVPEGYQPLATLEIEYKDSNKIYKADRPPDFDWDYELQVHPVEVLAAIKPDVTYIYNVDFGVREDGINHGTFNNKIFKFPKVPSLYSVLSMGPAAATNESIYGETTPQILKHMDGVQIVINNFDGGSHPFHIHGHAFQVIEKKDTGVYHPNDLVIPNSNISNPIRRDTVVVSAGGYVVIRFVADNPGNGYIYY